MRLQIGRITDYHRITTDEGEIICKNKVVVATRDETNQAYVCKVPVSPYNSQSVEFVHEDYIQLGMQVLFHVATDKMEGEILAFYDTSKEEDKAIADEFRRSKLLTLKKFGSSVFYKVFRDGSFKLKSPGVDILVDTYNSYVKMVANILKVSMTGITFTMSEGLMLFHMIQGLGMKHFAKVAVDLKMPSYIKFAFGRETAPLVRGEVTKSDQINIDFLDTLQAAIRSKYLDFKMDATGMEVEIYRHKIKIGPEEIVIEDRNNSRVRMDANALSVSKGKTGIEINSHGELTVLSSAKTFFKSKDDTVIEVRGDLYTSSMDYYMYHTSLGAYFRNEANIYAPNTYLQDTMAAVKPRDIKMLMDEHAAVAAMPHGNGNNGSPTVPPSSASALPGKNASNMKPVKPVAKAKYVKDVNFN